MTDINEAVLAEERSTDSTNESERSAVPMDTASSVEASTDLDPAFVGPPAPEQDDDASAIAIILGKKMLDLPADLYIPPDALRVFLESFQGPLDLLLYLIKRQNLDILDIPVAKITQQYVAYVELMQEMNFELAAEYLLMAAMLAEIKSRMLLPRVSSDDEEEVEDPRAELVRRLQEYERFKKAAEDLDALTWVDRDVFTVKAKSDHIEAPQAEAKIEMKDLLVALVKVFERAKLSAHHHIKKEALSLRERMAQVIQVVRSDRFTEFGALFDVSEGRSGVVVTFIAILELLRQNLIEMVQAEPFAPIHVKAVFHKEEDGSNDDD